MQESYEDKEGSEEEKVTAKIKISGPEQIFAYTIHFINLITGILVFTILMQTVPEYAKTISKVEAASGFPMSMMIYFVCPVAFLLGALSKLVYHTTSEPWKVAGGGMKWTRHQFLPKPRSDFVEEEIQLKDFEKPETITAEFNDILEVIHDRNV